MNGLDRYLVCQDYPGVRANMHCFVDTQGPFERASLMAAVGSLLEEVPLARSFVREAIVGMERFVARRAWVSEQELVRWLDRPVEETPEFLDAKMDLANLPPFRVLHVPRAEGGYRLVLTIHGSAADTTGGMIFLARLLQRYEENRTGSAHVPFPEDPPAQRFRSLLWPKGLRWILRMARRHVRSMDKVGVWNASLTDYETPRESSVRYRVIDVPAEAWERLKVSAHELCVTPNDLLLAASLRAADAYRQARKEGERPFRVLLPIDLRPKLGLSPSMQNFAGLARPLFHVGEVRGGDLPRLVSQRVLRGRDFERAIKPAARQAVLSLVLPPPALRSALRSADEDPRSFHYSYACEAVALPSDLCRPPGTERIWTCGFVPRQPGFGIWTCVDGDRVAIGVGYLSARVSEESVSRFLACYLKELLPTPDAGAHLDVRL